MLYEVITAGGARQLRKQARFGEGRVAEVQGFPGGVRRLGRHAARLIRATLSFRATRSGRSAW